MNNFQKLLIEILNLSENKKDFNKAKFEWEVYYITHSEEPDTCLCGHNPIIELCYIQNKFNLKKTLVGNCCVKHFNQDYDWYFYNIRRLKKGERPNIQMIEYLFDKQAINEWEYKFLLNMCNKKKLTLKQRAILDNLLKIILNKLKINHSKVTT